MLTKFPYFLSNCSMLSWLLWKRVMQTSWLRGSSCLCFSKYLATSSGSCWSRNRIGQTAAEPDAATDGEGGRSLPQISARIGSVNEGRFERRPRKLKRDVELRGVANGLPLPLVDANGQASLLGVPGIVKSCSSGDFPPWSVWMRGSAVAASTDCLFQIFTSEPAAPRSVAAATSACLRATARPFFSTSSLCANCSTRFRCMRGCSSPTCSRSCRNVRWSCDSVFGVMRFNKSRYCYRSASA